MTICTISDMVSFVKIFFSVFKNKFDKPDAMKGRY